MRVTIGSHLEFPEAPRMRNFVSSKSHKTPILRRIREQTNPDELYHVLGIYRKMENSTNEIHSDTGKFFR